MKVALLVQRFPPRWLGGTEFLTYHLALYLARKGHEIHVITFLDDGLPKRAMEQGFHVHRLGVPGIRFLGLITFWLRSLSLLRSLDPEVIHAQGTEVGIPGLLAGRFAGKPSVVWGQGSDIFVPSLLGKPTSGIVLRQADAVIALTEEMRERIRNAYHREDGIFVIPHGVELGKFDNLSREVARSQLQLRPDEKVILFVGSLRPVKGVNYLIQAMETIKKGVPKARLMLVGDGPDRETLEGLARELHLADSMSFIGRMPNERIPEYMAASDVFVLPSLSEGFSTVILEAMASGLPIVATRVGDMRQVIEEGYNGFLVEPRNPSQIAEKVLLLLEDEQLRERMSQRSREKVTTYSWDSTISKLLDVYSKVTGRSHL